MLQILQSFIISLSSLQSPSCQPFLIKMAEKKAGLAAQPRQQVNPGPQKGEGKASAVPISWGQVNPIYANGTGRVAGHREK